MIFLLEYFLISKHPSQTIPPPWFFYLLMPPFPLQFLLKLRMILIEAKSVIFGCCCCSIWIKQYQIFFVLFCTQIYDTLTFMDKIIPFIGRVTGCIYLNCNDLIGLVYSLYLPNSLIYRGRFIFLITT